MEPEFNDLELPKSGLLVREGTLCKRAKNGALVGRHNLSQIQSIEIGWEVNPAGIVFAVLCLGLVFVAWYLIGSSAWRWAAIVVLASATLMSALCVLSYVINIRFPDGQVRYPMLDLTGDGEGFVASVRELASAGRDRHGTTIVSSDAATSGTLERR